MKTWGTVLMFVITLFGMSTYINVYEIAPRTYTGQQSFNTIEEALTFQGVVVKEAAMIGATIEKSDLTIQSPPTISFRIISPALTKSIFGDTPVPFKYGEAEITSSSAKTHIIINFIVMPLILCGGLYLLWSKRVNDYLVRANESR
jgi:hypothetical protein